MLSYQNFVSEAQTKFVTVVEDKPYYLWQQEIQCHHFNENHPSVDLEVVVLYETAEPSDWAKHLSKTNSVHYYKINESIKEVASTYKPFYKSYGYYLYTNESGCQNFCGIDSDVIFNKRPNLSKINESDSWHFSDCTSYLSYDYLKKHLTTNQVNELCQIVGINLLEVKELKKVGGAQMFFKDFNPKMFEKIAYDGKKIHDYLEPLVKEGNKIQKFTSEMWAFAWNSALNANCVIDEELSFCWAVSPLSEMNKTTFTHFAGKPPEGSFQKVKWTNKNPIYEDKSFITVKDNCAYYWVQLMEKYKHLCYAKR